MDGEWPDDAISSQQTQGKQIIFGESYRSTEITRLNLNSFTIDLWDCKWPPLFTREQYYLNL